MYVYSRKYIGGSQAGPLLKLAWSSATGVTGIGSWGAATAITPAKNGHRVGGDQNILACNCVGSFHFSLGSFRQMKACPHADVFIPEGSGSASWRTRHLFLFCLGTWKLRGLEHPECVRRQKQKYCLFPFSELILGENPHVTWNIFD